MNILVTGSNGQLGTALQQVSAANSDNYFFTDIDTLDITNAKMVEDMVDEHDISMIINCAAYTNVDKAEDDRDAAMLLNATAVGILADAMSKRDGFLIHISTDYVYGGFDNCRPIVEGESNNPRSIYGATKLEGEKKAALCNHIIIRTSWLYSEVGKNFLLTIKNLLATKDEIKVVFDQIGTPTYATDLATAIHTIVESRNYINNQGIYHFSNEGVCSWYDFAKEIASITGLTHCKVMPCHSDEFPSKVTRPPFSVLDKTKIKTVFNIDIPYWKDSVKKCLTNVNNK